jgi:hypothetical protein
LAVSHWVAPPLFSVFVFVVLFSQSCSITSIVLSDRLSRQFRLVIAGFTHTF